MALGEMGSGTSKDSLLSRAKRAAAAIVTFRHMGQLLFTSICGFLHSSNQQSTAINASAWPYSVRIAVTNAPHSLIASEKATSLVAPS